MNDRFFFGLEEKEIVGTMRLQKVFFKTLKVELIYQNKYQTKQEAALSIFEYIETYYNKNRRHKQLNNLTILEYQKLINNNLKIVA